MRGAPSNSLRTERDFGAIPTGTFIQTTLAGPEAGIGVLPRISRHLYCPKLSLLYPRSKDASAVLVSAHDTVS